MAILNFFGGRRRELAVGVGLLLAGPLGILWAQSDGGSAPPPAAQQGDAAAKPQEGNTSAPAPAVPQQAAPPADAAGAAQGTPDALSNVVIRKESKLVLVDAVVTDKKGNYLRDLTQNEFKVYEDNKEQAISSFSSGSDPSNQANGQKRYLVLFFDNSTMQTPDQIQARNAANQFIAANAGEDRMMAVVDFGGALRIVQNFTANADLLKSAVAGVKNSAVNPNANVPGNQPITVASSSLNSLSTAEGDFGARSMLLAVRSLAKNLRTVPGRKMVVLFSGGFALNPENESELTATIDACNKSNVAIYSLDARGLVGGAPGGMARLNFGDGLTAVSKERDSNDSQARPRLVLASLSEWAAADPQRPGGGGGTGGTGGAGGGGRGGAGGGTGGTGGTGGAGGG
ncbi:MAG TPA: VWA domain-containing protein, partial [Candidatus Acidoferrum sp.]